MLTLTLCAFCAAPGMSIAQQMGPTTVADPRSSYDCDGTNLWLFEEIETSGWLGFYETWDFESCGFGQNIYFEGTTGSWRDMRIKRTRPVPQIMSQRELEAYSWMIPGVAFGVLFLSIFTAFLMALYYRIRAQKSFWLDCPLCQIAIPVEPDNPAGFHVLCPGCGDAGVVSEMNAKGKREFRVEKLNPDTGKEASDDA
jgi:hypothetical protein